VLLRRSSWLITSVVLAALLFDTGVGASSKWRVASSATPARSVDVQLQGVSCVSTNWCMAVGFSQQAAGRPNVLVERWNGSRWSIVATPPALNAQLLSVSCRQRTFCIAVGSASSKGLIERWNGKRWTIEPSLTVPGSPTALLSAVSCTSISWCMVAGTTQPETAKSATLTVALTHGAWQIATTPNPSPYANSLLGVSCFTASFCVASGNETLPPIPGDPDPNSTQPLALTWNGSQWASDVMSSSGDTYSYLQGVSCWTATQCTAVGYSVSKYGPLHPLFYRLAYGTWTRVLAPNGGDGTALSSVTCAHSVCDVVGLSAVDPTPAKTVEESVVRSTWVRARTPNPGHDNVLAAVTCMTADKCVAVGFRSTHTLVEKNF
jgi:hypothetical protein